MPWPRPAKPWALAATGQRARRSALPFIREDLEEQGRRDPREADGGPERGEGGGEEREAEEAEPVQREEEHGQAPAEGLDVDDGEEDPGEGEAQGERGQRGQGG